MLCNITLHGIEEELGIIYTKGYIRSDYNPKHRTFIRYADDFLIFCPTKEIAEESKIDINSILKKRGLQISEIKTKIVTSYEGFDFLGFNFRNFYKKGYERVNLGTITNSINQSKRKFVVTIVQPSVKSIKNIKLKIRQTFKKYQGHPLINLIKEMNRIIIGYSESKRTMTFQESARDLNKYVYEQQMLYLNKRHPKKSKGWIVNKYFCHLKTQVIKNKWVFTDPDSGFYMYQFIWFSKKINWPQIKSMACPDDIQYKDYFKERASKLYISKGINIINNIDFSLAKSQNFVCNVCEQPLVEGPLHRHHIIPTATGGKNRPTNLMILHKHCHFNVHYGNNSEYWTQEFKSFKERTSSKIKTSEYKQLELINT